jgi:hypothetical protein
MKYVARCSILATLVISLPAAGQAAETGAHPTIDPAKGWVSLFNGRDLSHWEIIDIWGGTPASGAWIVEDGALTRKGKAYIRTQRRFKDFELDLEFKVGPKTNSGIFLRYDREYSFSNKIYWWNGLLEIQLLDSYGKAQPDTHDCAALYDMVAPSKNTVKQPGQWNRISITARGSRIAVVLNGEQVLDVDLDQWTEAGKNPDGTPNKYHKPMKDMPREGCIVLQEHPGEIWFRNIYVRPLE